MAKIRALLLFLLIPALAVCQTGIDKYARISEDDYAPGELNIQFKSGPSLFQVMARIPGQVIRVIPEIRVVTYKLNPGLSVPEVARQISRDTMVEFAEPNFKVKPIEFIKRESASSRQKSKNRRRFTWPNDFDPSKQYGLQKMGFPTAWNLSTGDPSIVVAVIDCGINSQHEELKNQIAPGQYDFSQDDYDATDDLGNGHGTLCAGIVAAQTNNSLGIAGAGWKCRILPLKIWPKPTESLSALAITEAVKRGAKVISISYCSTDQDKTVQAAIDFAWKSGVLIVAAAGNTATPNILQYPAAYNHVLSVGASDDRDIKASFSGSGDWVLVAAPGVEIRTTALGSKNAYDTVDGTSASAPYVAGAAALLFSYWNAATNQTVFHALTCTCDPTLNSSRKRWVKHGRVNVARALAIIRTLKSRAPKLGAQSQTSHKRP